ncbi:MAG: hypothetical protein L0Z55_13310 [Planctomycetes bacterium]|nr:hypothetical protein [Planctomycetota bacterium]
MNCHEAMMLAHEALDGELESIALESFKEHLADCDACARQAESVRRTKKLLWVKARREPVPPQLERRVRASLAREAAQASKDSWVRAPWLRAAAALLVAAAVVLFVMHWTSEEPALVHAEIVHESLAKAHRTPASPFKKPGDLGRHLFDNFGRTACYPGLQQNQDIQLSGWCEESFGDRNALHLRYDCKGKALSCFVIFGDVIPKFDTLEQKALGSHMKQLPNGKTICYCTCSREGRTVLCYHSSKQHFVLVFDRELEETVYANLDPTLR